MGTNQTGNEQNIVNFNTLIARITTLSGYNPSRQDLAIEQLNAMKIAGDALIATLTTCETSYKNSIAARLIAFDNNDKFMTRVINSLKVSGAQSQTIAQAEGMVRDIKGIRASDKLTAEDIAAAKENGEEITQNTIHNKSFDKKVENLSKFVNLLSTIAEYKPNEDDLKCESLASRLEAQRQANEAVVTAEAALTSARIARDKFLFTPVTGLVDVASDVKLYLKSVYGTGSSEYKLVSGIRFVKR
ncbi:MAG: hypothetical protein PHV20_00180 [Bacteroidales bacterium]|nr:hypothetical protein [Bacteroidales bacterium]